MTPTLAAQLEADYAELGSLRAVGARRGVSHETVRRALKALGVEVRGRGQPPKAEACWVCGRAHHAQGLCRAHYSRWWRRGDVGAREPLGGGGAG